MNFILSVQSRNCARYKAQPVSRVHQHQRCDDVFFVIGRLDGQHSITAEVENIQLSVVSKPESEVPNINSDSQINF